MPFVLGARSLAKLQGVAEPLADTVRAAIHLTDVDFTVVQGLRTREEAYVNFGKGRWASECLLGGCPADYARPHEPKVTWLKKALGSKHITGRAVDLAVWRNGAIDWDAGSKDGLARYREIQRAMKDAARVVGVKTLVCGIDWASPDPGHYEI